jgi:hypothetical protein
MMRALAMRLFHLGLDAHVVGDMTDPPLGPGDLLVVSAGPGHFSTVAALVDVARAAGARTACVTAQPDGSVPAACDLVLVMPAQTMADDGADPASVLPMGSLFEGAQYVVFELLMLALRDRIGETAERCAPATPTWSTPCPAGPSASRCRPQGPRHRRLQGHRRRDLRRLRRCRGRHRRRRPRRRRPRGNRRRGARRRPRCLTLPPTSPPSRPRAAAAAEALAEWGTIDILVNNAGIALVAPALETPVEDWDA